MLTHIKGTVLLKKESVSEDWDLAFRAGEARVRTAARTSHKGSDAGDEMNDLSLDASIGAGTEGWIVRSGREIN